MTEDEQEQDERRDNAILTEIGKLTGEISELKQHIRGDTTDGNHPEESN